jgi:hypothetical protein
LKYYLETPEWASTNGHPQMDTQMEEYMENVIATYMSLLGWGHNKIDCAT